MRRYVDLFERLSGVAFGPVESRNPVLGSADQFAAIPNRRNNSHDQSRHRVDRSALPQVFVQLHQRGQCVEVRALPGIVGIRDSKNAAHGVVELPSTAWARLRGIKADRL